MTQDSNELLQRMEVRQAEIASDIKYIKKWSDAHTADDVVRFDKLEKNQAWQNKIFYGALGIVAFLEFVTKFTK